MKKILILVFCLPFIAFAQNIENSPYTRYGLGELVKPTIAAYRNMGYTSVAMVDRYHLNFNNPATYGFLGTTAFEAGANAKNTTLVEGDKKENNWGGAIDYIALGFPTKNPINDIYETKKKPYKVGMGISLNRFSKTSYDISGKDSINEVGSFRRNYSGNGGLYKFQVGTGILYKKLAFGVNFGYLFGNIATSREIIFNDLENAFNTFNDKDYHLKAFTLSTGLIYSIDLNKKEMKENASLTPKILRFGLTFSPNSSFTTYKNELYINRQSIGSGIVSDTVLNVNDFKSRGKLPGEIGFGIMYQNGEKSAFTAEIKSSNWSNYYNEASGEKINNLSETMSFGIGGYYRPDFKSYSSFWKRASYKYGGYYNNDPRIAVDKKINQYGLTAGIGLPFVFQRKIAHTDIGIDIGRIGSGTVIEENYIKINFGFTFNDDEWFMKRKYN